MFFKLAIHNVRRSLRDYAIYFLTLTFGVCLFYVFNSMDSQQAMTFLNSNQREIIQLLTSAIGYVSIFISFILGFLVVYSNRFLMKRRKKELGIYMLLGMDKGKISRILIIETLLIGIFSLGIGLAVGIFASQGLSAITAGIFEMDLSSFQFTFSLSAFYKTLLYFGIIFLIVMIFNTISISKYKLITLLQASRKNESFKVRNIWISIIAFIVSIACFAAAYYLVLTRGWESGGMLLTCIILGCVGTLLFFFSLSGILLRVIKANKKLYYKGLNMFIFRQISSKINTAFISIGLICLMLFVTMVTFSAGISIAHASSQAVKSAAPYDISITKSIYQGDTQTQPTENKKVTETFQLQSQLDLYSKNYIEIALYDNLLTMSDLPNVLPDIPSTAQNSSMRAVSLSDYNRVLESQGKEPISLGDNEFAINCNSYLVEPYYHMENNQSITFNGKEYQLGIHKLLQETLSTDYSLIDSGTIVLPDSALNGLTPNKHILNVLYRQSDSDYAQGATEAFQNSIIKHIQNNETNVESYGYSIIDKESVYQSNVGTSVIVSFIAIYIGLIFLITCVAILALQQLAEASDNTVRYNLLRKLGADPKMIHHALFTQIAIYFAMPLLLAIVHTVVGIKFSSTMVQMFGSGTSILTMSLVTAGIMLVVYGGYFLATYWGCKSMIRPKKN